MKRFAVVLALLCLPVSAAAQSLVGYWSSESTAIDRSSGQHVVLHALIRFGDSTFVSILKSDDGSGVLGTGAIARGDWQVQTVFGVPALCVRRTGEATGPCHPFTVAAATLTWGGIPFVRVDSAAVETVAPELTRGISTFYPLTPADDSLLTTPKAGQPASAPPRIS